MSTIKVVVLGVMLAGLVSIGAAMRQSSSVAACKECLNCQSGECSNFTNHTLCAIDGCSECSTEYANACSPETREFVYKGKAPACSACATEAADSTKSHGDMIPDDISLPAIKASSIQHASDEDFTQFVNDQSGTVLVDFYADWCGPCKLQGAILEGLANSLEKATVVKVNVDDSPGLAKRFEITGIPALLVFREGKLVKTNVGVAGAEKIQSLIAGE